MIIKKKFKNRKDTWYNEKTVDDKEAVENISIRHLQEDLEELHWQNMEEVVRSMQRIPMEKKEKAEWQQAIWDRPEKEVPV